MCINIVYFAWNPPSSPCPLSSSVTWFKITHTYMHCFKSEDVCFLQSSGCSWFLEVLNPPGLDFADLSLPVSKLGVGGAGIFVLLLCRTEMWPWHIHSALFLSSFWDFESKETWVSPSLSPATCVGKFLNFSEPLFWSVTWTGGAPCLMGLHWRVWAAFWWTV